MPRTIAPASGRVITDTEGHDGRPAVLLRSAEIPARQRRGGASTIPLVSQQVGAKDFLNGISGVTTRIDEEHGTALQRQG